MKKFQNLITNRLKRKNNLMSSDVKRVFPINKVHEGTAKVAEAPISFMDGIGKSHPKLFSRYEKANQKSHQSMYDGFTGNRHPQSCMASTSKLKFRDLIKSQLSDEDQAPASLDEEVDALTKSFEIVSKRPNSRMMYKSDFLNNLDLSYVQTKSQLGQISDQTLEVLKNKLKAAKKGKFEPPSQYHKSTNDLRISRL